MTAVFRVAVAVEALTGLALVASPAWVVWLILGHDLATGAVVPGRIAGLALLAFAAACWHWPNATARRAILLFQPLIAVPLLGVALVSALGGPLLWPAILYHVGAGVTLSRGRG
ncbi:hypothetical protein AAFN86_07840 [Roseomonas sp. CAU 1739]|uniref:hypothetical protein n=1 Tax=Roseomonas sp. CAU 1739 TaxID=3140364 RepID=UPI00325B7481